MPSVHSGRSLLGNGSTIRRPLAQAQSGEIDAVGAGACARTIEGMNRTLIIIGITLLIIGLLWKPLSALPLFRLPGDFVINRPGFRFYFPLTSMILISALVSLILWLFRR